MSWIFVDKVLGSWILIAFKREFPFEDVLRLWEVLWTDYYTNGMVLFVALAVLESHRDVILRYLVEFDEILKVTFTIFSPLSKADSPDCISVL